jgi:hypothetical protein
VGSNPFQDLRQPIFQPHPANHDIVPLFGEELPVQVFWPQAQIGLEGCRPVAAILGPPLTRTPSTSTMRALITRPPAAQE